MIDWELSTLGNPMADLSYFLLTWVVPLDPSGRSSLIGTDLIALGIPTAEEIIDRYFARSDILRPDSFTFYYAYNMFRVAAILHGIAARNRAGNASSEQAKSIGLMVRSAIRLACDMVDDLAT